MFDLYSCPAVLGLPKALAVWLHMACGLWLVAFASRVHTVSLSPACVQACVCATVCVCVCVHTERCVRQDLNVQCHLLLTAGLMCIRCDYILGWMD